MRIVLNKGANVSDAEVERYGFCLLPQQIAVDGKLHDTRGLRAPISQADIDDWVRTAKVHPYVLGTSAAEFVEVFRQVAARDREILAVMVSRHLMPSYASAVSATRTLAQIAGLANVRTAVIDTQSVDLGTGMAAVFAAEAALAGVPFDRIARLTERFARRSRFVFAPRELSYLVKGGRASFLKATMANLLGRSPILGFEEGEVRPAGTVSRTELIDGIARTLVQRIAKTQNAASASAKRPVWLGIIHGGDESGAQTLATVLKRQLDVHFCTVRPASAPMYLHVGPKSLGAYACPIDLDSDVDWVPPKAPRSDA